MKREIMLWLFVSLGFIGLMFFIGRESERYQREIRDLQSRLSLAEEQVDTFIIRDSIPVAHGKVVVVDKTDYKTLLADKELIKDLKLRVSELESENRVLLSTRDTVVLYRDNDSTFTYSDKWCSFSYDQSTGVLDWEVRDSLLTFVSAEYRHHFLIFRWGKKGYRVTHVNFNPRSRIVYDKYIKIK